MNEAHAAHPSLEQLTAFDQGQLTAGEWDSVEHHLAGCQACCRQLERLPEDPLVALMRASTGQSGAAPHPRGGSTDSSGASAAPAQAEVPSELAAHPRYRVRALLGAGGMGAVFKAEHLLMGRPVALKVIHRHLLNRPAAVERFRQEVRAAARLAHPNIVTAHDADQAGDTHFLVMEFVEGTSLDRLVQPGRPCAVADACDWVRQAALGLQHAFERGMVHRDLKPQNLLLTPGGQVKVLDFGLARFLSEDDADAAVTPSGVVVGTPDYMAPEQGLDPRRADVRADIYSLGCTLYHLLAGHPPFPGGTPLQKLLSHQDRRPQPLAEVRPEVPPTLAQLVERMTDRDPALRPQTPAEVVRELAPFVQASSLRTAPPLPAAQPGGSPPRFRFRKHRTLLLGGVLLAAATLLGLGLWRLFGSGQDGTKEGLDRPATSAGEVRRWGGRDGPFTAVAVSADCRHALTAGPDGTLRFWDLRSGRVVGRMTGHSGTVLSLAFAPDGRRAVSGARDNTVRVWDLEGRRAPQVLRQHTGWVRSVQFLDDGRQVLSAGDDGQLVLWDVQEGRPRKVLVLRDAGLRSVAPSPSGRHAVTGGTDGAVRLWDLGGARQTSFHNFRGHRDVVTSAVFSADGRYLLSGSQDQVVRFWRIEPGMGLQRLTGHTGPVRCVDLSPDNRWALSGGDDRSVRLWDLEAGREAARLEGHAGAVLRVVFCPGGRYVLSGGEDGTLRLWRLPVPENHGRRLVGHRWAILAGAMTPDGKTVVTGGADHLVKVWDTASGRERITLRGHLKMVWSVAVSRDGKTVVSGSDDRTVRVWEADTGRVRATLRGHRGVVRSVALAPDGQTVASGSHDKTVRLWDVATRQERFRLLGHHSSILALAFMVDGRTLATGNIGLDERDRPVPGEIKLWDVATGTERTTFKRLPGSVLALAFSPDGRTLAASQNGVVTLWDVATGRERTTLKGINAKVRSLSFTADGRTLATGSADRLVQLWDAGRGTEQRCLRGHLEGVTFVALSADGNTLASGGEDAVLKLWDLTRVPR
jgi:WD40 repeat protein